MKYYIDNEEIKTDYLHYLGSGLEGKVFEHKELAAKILYDRGKVKLTYENANYMIKVSEKTNQILLPFKLVQDENNTYSGAATVNLGRNNEIANFQLLNKEEIKTNFENLKNEVIIVAKQGIILKDLCTQNTILKNKVLYLVDYSSYIIKKIVNDNIENTIINENLKELEKLFKEIINDYLIEEKVFGINIDDINTFINQMNNHEALYEYKKRLH